MSAPEHDQIGPYRLLEALGQGGMGVVYRAEHEATRDHVALKTVRLPGEDVVATIRREIRALARTRHSGVARIVAEGTHKGLPWYAMELIEGRTLRQFVGELMPSAPGASSTATDAGGAWWTSRLEPAPTPTLPPGYGSTSTVPEDLQRPEAAGGRLEEALRMARRICAPLAFLHGRGIVHCDLKPENVIIRDDQTPVLVDFGLTARFWGELSREVLDLGMMSSGTIAYMAPEQIRGEFVDPRTDLYAFGVMLYLLVTGREPFSGDSVPAVALKHLETPPPPPSVLARDVPTELELLILRLLAKDARERIGYADDVAAALSRLLGDELQPPSGQPYVYRPGFVGRAAALDDVEQRLTDVHHQQGSVLLLAGPSGSGKTRFVAECAHRAKRRGMQTFGGACFPQSTSGSGVSESPLAGFRRLLQLIADRCRARGEMETQRLLGKHGPVLAEIEPSLHDLPGQAELPRPEKLGPQEARLRLYDALAWTMGALAIERPMLIVIDDLHWADELTHGFLDHLLTNGGLNHLPALFLCTWRTDEPGAHPAVFEHATRIELARLGTADVGEMVGDMLALRPPPRALVRFLSERARGNPFFVTEYVRTAVERGALVRSAQGTWQLADGRSLEEGPFDDLEVPDSLTDLVRRRLDTLPEGPRELAQTAAVLGHDVDAEVLAAMHGRPESETTEALDALLQAHVLEQLTARRLRFVHDPLQDRAYESLEDARRRALHARAAELLDSGLGGDRGGRLAAIAQHWERAGEVERAQAYYLQAARQAAERYASAAAERLYQAWLWLAGDDDPAALPVMLELGEIWELVGRWEDAERLFRDASTHAHAAGVRGAEADARLRLGHLLHLRGAYDEALEELKAARTLHARDGRIVQLGRALGEIGRIHRKRGEFDVARDHFERQLTVALSHDATAQVIAARANLGRLHYHQGKLDAARECFDEAYRLAAETGDQRAEASALGDLGNVHLQRGRYAEALDCYERQLSVAARIGDRRAAGEAVRQIGVAQWRHGHFERALTCYVGSLRVALELGDQPAAAVALARAADALVTRGDVKLADRAFRSGIALLEQAQMPYYLSAALVRHAELLARRGELQEAAVVCDQAATVARRVGRDRIRLHAELLALRLDVDRGRMDAHEALTDLEERLPADPQPLDRAALAYTRWQIDPSEEHAEAAAEAYRVCLTPPSATARLRYREITGEELEGPELDALPPTLRREAGDLELLLEQAEGWVDEG